MLRVISITPDDVGHELTDRISGLSWSNARPGGDEVANFTLHRPWSSPNPEITKLSTLVIYDGLDVLWQGRIEEHQRGAEGTETVAVTAYGLGTMLKDKRIAEIYITHDLGGWSDPSTAQQINIRSIGGVLIGSWNANGPGEDSDSPAIKTQYTRVQDGVNWLEVWFYGGGVDIGAIAYDLDANGEVLAQDTIVYLSSDDKLTSSDAGTDHSGTDATDESVVATVDGRKYALIRHTATSAGAADVDAQAIWKNIEIVGRASVLAVPAGLAAPFDDYNGLAASTIIEDIVGRLDSDEIVVRRMDDTTYIITESVVNGSHEEAITETNRFDAHERTWGTWGPDSPLEDLGTGQFDYTEISDDAHWLAHREDCDSISLDSETSSLYNRVTVNYTDATGVARSVSRSTTVAELGSTVRRKTLDLGQGTTEAARTLGDTFLALFGGFAPARGTVTLSKPIRHADRGLLPPHYLRADGSNLRLPDVLPSTTLLALDDTPDRRTTFPIKRVSVDASGERIATTVEVDQASDALSALTERLGAATELVGA